MTITVLGAFLQGLGISLEHSGMALEHPRILLELPVVFQVCFISGVLIVLRSFLLLKIWTGLQQEGLVTSRDVGN